MMQLTVYFYLRDRLLHSLHLSLALCRSLKEFAFVNSGRGTEFRRNSSSWTQIVHSSSCVDQLWLIFQVTLSLFGFHCRIYVWLILMNVHLTCSHIICSHNISWLECHYLSEILNRILVVSIIYIHKSFVQKTEYFKISFNLRWICTLIRVPIIGRFSLLNHCIS